MGLFGSFGSVGARGVLDNTFFGSSVQSQFSLRINWTAYSIWFFLFFSFFPFVFGMNCRIVFRMADSVGKVSPWQKSAYIGFDKR